MHTEPADLIRTEFSFEPFQQLAALPQPSEVTNIMQRKIMHFKFNIYLLDCESTLIKNIHLCKFHFCGRHRRPDKLGYFGPTRVTNEQNAPAASDPMTSRAFKYQFACLDCKLGKKKKKPQRFILIFPISLWENHVQHWAVIYSSSRAADNGRKLCPVNADLTKGPVNLSTVRFMSEVRQGNFTASRGRIPTQNFNGGSP